MANNESTASEKLLAEGNRLKEQLKIADAIEKYSNALQLEPNFLAALNQLSGIYESDRKFDKAIPLLQRLVQLLPQNGRMKARLATVMMQKENIDEAISLYQQAIVQDRQLPAWAYIGLGNAWEKKGGVNEAIIAYEQAVQLQPKNFYLHQKLIVLLRMQERYKEAATWAKQLPQVKQGKIYSKIWQALNENSSQSLEEECINYPTEFDKQQLEQYFELTSQYKTINLTSLSGEDSEFLSSHNISFAKLRWIAKISNYSSTEQEVYLKHFDSEFKRSAKTIVEPSKYPLYPFLESILETGYIYAICPISGRFLRSDGAFILIDNYLGVIYRFVGDKIFYLSAGWTPGGQFLINAVYFPHLDLIIELINHPYLNFAPSLNLFKEWAVSNWKLVKSLIYSKDKASRKLMCAVEFHFNIGHNLVNDLSGIEILLKAGLLSKVDKFFVGDHEYFGNLENLYPEIPPEKIIRLKNKDDSNKNVSKIALENNYLPLAIRGCWVSEDLASRIHRVSQQKCSQSFLARVREGKKHFPLIWISFRVHNRSWISQIEGIANIVNSLYVDFPNLGVVFDGFSFADCHIDKDDNLVNRKKGIVNQENAIVKQISELVLNKNIGVYNTIGCKMHESIIWAYAANFYLASMGAALTKVSLLANKPGIQHSCSAYVKVFKNWYNTANRENAVTPITIPEKHIIDIDSSNWSSSYDCDWRIIYDEAAKMAQNLSKK